jgi:prefoldin subunit 5
MTESEARETQVSLQMENLKDRLSELEKSIASMKTRLSSVLRSDIFENDEKAPKDQEALVPLANDIRSSANRINRLNVEVITLLKELEL